MQGESISTQNSNPSRLSSNPSVGFPSQRQPQKGNKRKVLFIILGVIIVLAILGSIWFVLSDSQEEITPTPTPFVDSLTNFDEFENTEPEETEEIKRDEITIKVLNGTGISGEASYLQGKLGALGYSDIETGNATSQDNEATSVTFPDSLSKTAVEEITKELESIYEEVETDTSSSATKVEIITGLRKGQTPKPSATATPKASATPTPTPSPSPSGN